MSRVTKTYDDDLELKDAYAVTTSAAATVGGAARVIDLGTGLVEGDIIIDISAIEVNSDDERYSIIAQVSSTSNFASDVYGLLGIVVGSAGTGMHDNIPGDKDLVAGRYRLPFTNEVTDGVTKRYLRLWTQVAGTVVTGINYTAYLARK